MMGRWWAVVWMLVLVGWGLVAVAIPASATADPTADLAQASGAEDVPNGLDRGIQAMLEELGLSPSSPETALDHFTLSQVWTMLADVATDAVRRPLDMLAGIVTIVLLGALLAGLPPPGRQDAAAQVLEYIGTLGAVAVLADPLCQCFERVQAVLTQGADFMTLFVPVFAALLAAGGTAGGAICYQTAVIALSDGVIQLMSRMLLPLCTMGFALAMVDAISPSVSVGGLLTLSRKLTTWTLGLLMSIFLGVLSLQSWIGTGVDTAATRTTRYVIANAVPVVGGAVSDAYGAVRTSLQMLRNTTGVIGIVALCLLFLPPLCELLCYRLVVAVGAALAELFGTGRLLKLFQGTGQALAIAFALLICFGIMFVVATAIAMTLATGAA